MARPNPGFDPGQPGDVFQWDGGAWFYLLSIEQRVPRGVLWNAVNLDTGAWETLFMNRYDRFNGWTKL